MLQEIPEKYLDEIRQLHSELGRRPTEIEWRSRFRHGGSLLQKLGGYSAIVDASFEHRSLEFTPVPDQNLSINELLERRKSDFLRKDAYEKALANREVNVNIDGPFGIAHFGDPHLDDDGCDIVTLERDKKIVQDTPGLFGANVGDVTNNWVGRLAQLYGQQSTSEAQAWQLCEWFLGGIEWLYLVSGNHDAWSGEKDPISWISRQLGLEYTKKTSIRLFLKCRNGRQVIVNARHDFPGHSMWNSAHGPMRAAQMGWRDHLLTCGHRHCAGYGILKDPATGRITHALRVPSYKVYDSYAEKKGFPDQCISPCPVTIINPDSQTEAGLITTIWDTEAAADYLSWMRSRRCPR